MYTPHLCIIIIVLLRMRSHVQTILKILMFSVLFKGRQLLIFASNVINIVIINKDQIESENVK